MNVRAGCRRGGPALTANCTEGGDAARRQGMPRARLDQTLARNGLARGLLRACRTAFAADNQLHLFAWAGHLRDGAAHLLLFYYSHCLPARPPSPAFLAHLHPRRSFPPESCVSRSYDRGSNHLKFHSSLRPRTSNPRRNPLLLNVPSDSASAPIRQRDFVRCRLCRTLRQPSFST